MLVVRFGCIVFTLLVLCVTGCVTTGIVEYPDLKALKYGPNGRLMYKGEEVVGIKRKLPWYKEMWPDNAAECGFSLFAFTSGTLLGGALAGDNGNNDTSDGDQIDISSPTHPSSSSSSDSSTTSGGSTPSAPAPAPTSGGGGGDESPW